MARGEGLIVTPAIRMIGSVSFLRKLRIQGQAWESFGPWPLDSELSREKQPQALANETSGFGISR
jgi:hypothetical protein